jgi:ribosomal protein L11 methyltransferase
VLLEITLRADDRRAGALADALLEAGALSVSVEDASAGTAAESPLYGEPGLEPASHAWQSSRLRVLLEGEREAAEKLVETACDSLAWPTLPIEACAQVREADWVRESQAQFPATRISDRFWIVPTWHEVPAGAEIVVRLDPGVAFGTGTHPTTQLCLAWLEAHVRPGARVLDYGCGSGILAIAAGRLGASDVTGVDIDEQALAAARVNSAANGVIARYTAPDALEPGRFDIVVANILSNPLKLLAPALLARVSPGGALALSGILQRQADEVRQAYAAADPAVGLKRWRAAEGWVCLAGMRSR